MLKRWRLIGLHAVFRNLVALVITSGETTCGYQELHMSRKLEHGPRHYIIFYIYILIQKIVSDNLTAVGFQIIYS